MKASRAIMLGAASALWAHAASAAPGPSAPAWSTRAMMGAGSVSCGAWLEDATAMRLSWILGFLSRASVAWAPELLKAVDAPAVKAWTDNYCRAHPLNVLQVAAEALEAELADRQNLAPAAPPRR